MYCMRPCLLITSAIVLFCLPLSAAAAQFATQPLFLSRSPVAEGDTVLIYAMVSNNDSTKFTGSLAIKDAGGPIGTLSVVLGSGEAQALSVSWTPMAGTHTVTASLMSPDGSVVESESAVFVVDPRPGASAASGGVGSSAPLEQDLANISPSLASTSHPLYATIAAARGAAAHALSQGIGGAEGQMNQGQVLGTSTQAAGTQGSTATFWSLLGTLVYYFLSALQYLVVNAALFYPFLAVLFIFTLWRVFRRMSRGRMR